MRSGCNAASVFVGIDHGNYLFDAIIEIDTNDFVVRHHHIVDRYFFQIEDADQHASILV